MNTGTQRAGNKLGTETDSQYRLARPDKLPDEFFFIRQPWVERLILHVHRTTQNQQKINRIHFRKGIALEKPCGGQGASGITQPRFQLARALNWHLLKNLDMNRSRWRQKGHYGKCGVLVGIRVWRWRRFDHIGGASHGTQIHAREVFAEDAEREELDTGEDDNHGKEKGESLNGVSS